MGTRAGEGSRRADHLRLFVVVVKLVTGSVELISATILLIFSAGFLRTSVNRLLAHEATEDPHDLLVSFVHQHMAKLLTEKSVIAATLIVLGVMKVIGAIGLLRRRPWAYYLLLALVVVLLPFDAYQLARSPAWLEGALFALNVAVLVILLRFREALVAREEA